MGIEPRFSTDWEREDYEREKRGEAPLGPFGVTGQPTDTQIDAGAAALRQRLQGGKKIRPWQELPNGPKRKWRDYAAVVLCAAFKV